MACVNCRIASRDSCDVEIRLHTLGEKLRAGRSPSFAKDRPEQEAEGLRCILFEYSLPTH